MIYGKIKNIGCYKGQSQWLDKAIDFLKITDLKSLPIGRIEISGEKVFANVMEAEAKEENNLKFEFHKRYMDIQIDIEGTENIQIGIKTTRIVEKYIEEKDIGIADCTEYITCKLGEGNFIICMAEEPHKPGIVTKDNRYLKKCVLKVAVN